jgi:hypothetical protein
MRYLVRILTLCMMMSCRVERVAAQTPGNDDAKKQSGIVADGMNGRIVRSPTISSPEAPT